MSIRTLLKTSHIFNNKKKIKSIFANIVIYNTDFNYRIRPTNEIKIPLCTDQTGFSDNISMGNVYLRKPMLSKQSIGVSTNTITATPMMTTCNTDNKTNTVNNVILSDKGLDVIKNKSEHFVQEIVLGSCLAASNVNCAAESPTGLRKRNVYFEIGLNKKRLDPSTVRNDLNKWIENNKSLVDTEQLPFEDEPVIEAEIMAGCDDDGFESFNGKSSSGEEHSANRRPLLNTSENISPAIGQREAIAKKDKHSDSETNYIDSRISTSNVSYT